MSDTATDNSAAAIFTKGAMQACERISIGFGEIAVFSARSPVKESENEDAAVVIRLDASSAILAVADGMGGRPAGEDASALAMRTLYETFAGSSDDDGRADEWRRTAILDALEQANRAVVELGIGAGTTVVVAEIMGGMLRPYHVGDSMILLVGNRGALRHATLPHSPVGYAVHAGVLDAAEAMHHADRHLVSNLVGAADMWVDVGSPIAMQQRDTLLLASDGLFDNLHLAEIIDIIRKGPLERAASHLAEAARLRMTAAREGEPSKPDDLTFVLFRQSARSARRSRGDQSG